MNVIEKTCCKCGHKENVNVHGKVPECLINDDYYCSDCVVDMKRRG